MGTNDGGDGSVERARGVRRFRGVLAGMREDLDVVMQRDPAATSLAEACMYPHVHALWAHRVSHHLYLRGHRLVARAVSLFARFATGLDIHPGATIGRRLFVDHGHGVVIGETAEIGDDVTMYHQVTLGAVGWWKDVRRPRGSKRHPTLGDGVIVGAGSQILGPITVGAGSKVGAHSLLLESVPPGSVVRGATATVIRWGKTRPVEEEARFWDLPSPGPNGGGNGSAGPNGGSVVATSSGREAPGGPQAPSEGGG